MMALKIEVSSLAYVIIRPSTVLIYVLKHYVGNVYVFTGSGSSWTFVTKYYHQMLRMTIILVTVLGYMELQRL